MNVHLLAVSYCTLGVEHDHQSYSVPLTSKVGANHKCWYERDDTSIADRERQKCGRNKYSLILLTKQDVEGVSKLAHMCWCLFTECRKRNVGGTLFF